MIDLEATFESMSDDELLEYQQTATRLRLDANAAGRRAQDELDARAAARAERRAEEDARLGAVTKPPTQRVF